MCEHAILNVALRIQPTRPRPPKKQAPPQTRPRPRAGPAPTLKNGLVPKSPERCSPRGNREFCREMSSSDPESSGQMWDIATVASPPPFLFLPPLSLPPIIPFVTPPPPFLRKRLVTGWAASANQEHSSPMRWHERPTLRSSFTILRTASSRPRPRWSNRQSCCSGRRWSMQNT